MKFNADEVERLKSLEEIPHSEDCEGKNVEGEVSFATSKDDMDSETKAENLGAFISSSESDTSDTEKEETDKHGSKLFAM